MKDQRKALSLRHLVDIRSGESRLVALAAATACVVVSLNVVTIGTATALVLGEHAPSVLPPLYSAGALVSIVATLGLSSAVGRLGRWVETAGGMFAFAASLLLGWSALFVDPRTFVLLVYPWAVVGSSLFVVQAFTLINETLDSGQARRLFPLIGAGGSVGAIAGGVGLVQLAGPLGVRNLLLLAAALAAGAGLGAHGLLRHRGENGAVPAAVRHAPPTEPNGWSTAITGLGSLLQNRLLMRLVLVALATGIASTVFRFAFEVELKRNYGPAQIAAFIGGFNVACNVGALMVQGLVERSLIRSTGFVAGLVSLPLVLGVGGLTWLFVGGIWAMAAVRGAENVARYSVARTADELVVVPLSSVEKRRARLLIGGLVVPGSTLLASLLIAALKGVHPHALATLTLVTAGLATVAALSTRKPYWHQLGLALSNHRLQVRGGTQNALLLNERTRSFVAAALEADSEQDTALSLFLAARTGLMLPRERIETFYLHPSELVRRVALSLAAAWGDELWAPALVELLRNEKSSVVAAAAVLALAEVDSKNAPRNLERWLDDPRQEVRIAALGMVGGEAAVPELVAALRKRDQARAASEALRRRPYTSLIPARPRDPMAAASEALRSRHHAAVVPALAPLLKEANEAGSAAARILGQLVDVRATAALVAALPETSGLQRRNVLGALTRHRERGCGFGVHLDSLRVEIRRELESLLICRLLTGSDASADGPARSILEAECRFQRRAAEASLCDLLALSFDVLELQKVRSNLGRASRHTRSLTLDLLRHMLPEALGYLVMPYLEDTPPAELLLRAPGDLGWPPDGPCDWRAVLLAERQPWLRHLQLAILGGLPRTVSETKVMSLLNEVYLLREFPLFAELAPEHLLFIAELSEQLEVPAGTVIFEQGDPGDAFYLILRGEVLVTRGSEVLRRLHARDCFGEAALLDSGLRTATVKAATDCEFSVIARHDFDDLLDAHPSIARGMLAIMARRLA